MTPRAGARFARAHTARAVRNAASAGGSPPPSPAGSLQVVAGGSWLASKHIE